MEGQIQGGVVQGIGWALSEGYFYREDGSMANASFLDYRMPTALDLPLVETVLVEVANPASPHGIRGVGEVPLVPPMAAIANAIYDAVGVRLGELPMSPDKVIVALHNNQLQEAAGCALQYCTTQTPDSSAGARRLFYPNRYEQSNRTPAFY